MRPVCKLLLFFALCVLVPFALACGDDDDDPQPGTTPQRTATGTATKTQAAASPAATKASGQLILATTTSTQDSGLLDVLVPMFEEETGYSVTTIAVGSGQAIEQASRGDADVVFAHSPAAEQKMVDEGNGIERTLVMHNDFIIVGPASDPAGIGASASAAEAMKGVATGEARFISRGDDSGTHALEQRLWASAEIEPAGQSWYEETGQGMGATLQVANQKQGYTISDRGTYLAQGDAIELAVIFEGDPALLNVYHVIVVNPEKHPDVNVAAARAWAAFVTRADIQELIGEFGVEEFGEPLFFPDAGKPEPTG